MRARAAPRFPSSPQLHPPADSTGSQGNKPPRASVAPYLQNVAKSSLGVHPVKGLLRDATGTCPLRAIGPVRVQERGCTFVFYDENWVGRSNP
jgi:hypothetical protein